MAHNLNKVGDKVSMFYYGDQPWHKLGQRLDNPATAVEAISASGLDYEVGKEAIYFHDGFGKLKNYEGKVVTYRKDTGDQLGIVGEGYKIVQNAEAFNFFDVLVGEGQAIYHTAGALGRGERVWILAKLPNDIVVNGSDKVEKYLVLTNSHDGLSTLKVYFTPIRVVCQNTLTASLRDAKSGISIRHSGNISGKIEEARKVLNISVNYYDQFEKIVKGMGQVKITKDQAVLYFSEVMSSFSKADGVEMSKQTEAKVEICQSLFVNGMGNDNPDVKGTLWTAYNAVTEFCDYHRGIKGMDLQGSGRINDALFGTGAGIKAVAFDQAMAMVG